MATLTSQSRRSNPATAQLSGSLEAVARKGWMLNVIALGSLLGGGALLAFFGLFILDWMTHFPALVRVILTLGICGASSVWLPRRFRKLWHRQKDPVMIARMVEKQRLKDDGKGYGSALVSGLEFGMRPEIGGSHQLKGNVMRIATSQDPGNVALHDPAKLRLGIKLGSGALVIFLLWLIISPTCLAIFIQRSIGMNAVYPTATKIVDLNYPEVSAKHQPITIRATVSGEIPATGRIVMAYEGESDFEVVMQPDGDVAEDQTMVFSSVLENPAKDLTFQLFIGDASTERFTIRVPKPPFIEDGSVTISPPEYTGLGTRQTILANLDVPENSRFTMKVKPDRELASCRLDLKDKMIDFQPDPEQPGWYVLKEILLKSTNTYAIELTDKDGISNVDRVYYRMGVIPDLLATVTLDQPENDSYWAPMSRLTWSMKASDDYGIKAAKLKCQIGSMTESGEVKVARTETIDLPVEPGQKEMNLTRKMNLLDLKTKAGDIVLMTVMIQDNCTENPDKRWQESGSVRLYIVSPADLRRIIEEEEQMVYKLIGDLKDDMKHQMRVLEMQSKIKKERQQ